MIFQADASLLQQSSDNISSKLEGERFNFDKIQRHTVNNNMNISLFSAKSNCEHFIQ